MEKLGWQASRGGVVSEGFWKEEGDVGVTEAPRNSETLYGETYRVSAETCGAASLHILIPVRRKN